MTPEDLRTLVNATLAADPGTGPHDVARVVAEAVLDEVRERMSLDGLHAAHGMCSLWFGEADYQALKRELCGDALAPRQEEAK